MAIEELARADGFRVGALGPVLVTVFRSTATVERLETLESVQAAFVRTHPKMFALNIVVGTKVQAPPPGVREISARLQTRFDGNTVGSATVLAVTGLGAVIARSFLAALALVAGGTKPTETFKTTGDAVKWISGLKVSLPGLASLGDHLVDLEQFVAQTP